MRGKILLSLASLYVVGAALWLAAGGIVGDGDDTELLNVSYDPTRELWRDVNKVFIEQYEKDTGIRLTIRQSHGGSTTQARAVIDGLPADVVTLALWSDTDAIRRAGLIDAGDTPWQKRLPHDSLPYHSTLVFVVRKGNPKNIHDWPDLIRPGVAIITPNPQTSGNGKLSFLAAWGAALERKGATAQDALNFVTEMYQHTPVLESGARGATVTFAKKGIGDVHLTWENEAHLEVKEARGALEIVYPPVSILAEPHVAVVSANVRRKKTQAHAEAYMRFLYTPEAQELIARHYYRPFTFLDRKSEVSQGKSEILKPIRLFPVTRCGKDWDEIQSKFFAKDGVFERIYQPR